MENIALFMAIALIFGGCATTRIIQVDENGRPVAVIKDNQLKLNSRNANEQVRVEERTTDVVYEIEGRKTAVVRHEQGRQLNNAYYDLELKAARSGQLVAPTTGVMEGPLPVVFAYYGDYDEHRTYEVWYLGSELGGQGPIPGQKKLRVLVTKGGHQIKNLRSGWYAFSIRNEDGRIIDLNVQGKKRQTNVVHVLPNPVEEYPPNSGTYYHALVWSSDR